MQWLPSDDLCWLFFVVVWLGLGVASSAFFYLSKNTALKRRAWMPFMVLTGLLFAAFVGYLSQECPGSSS
jgi:hypothetical protein